MTTDDVRGIIRRLKLKHPEIVLTGDPQLQGDVFFMTFEFIDTNLANIHNWIDRAGGKTLRVGIEGTGDNTVMYAVVK